MNRLFALLTALSLMAITLTPAHAFAYSAGDTCILTKIVELRIDPRSSGKKRYLKPGTEVVIIEKFRKRVRVAPSLLRDRRTPCCHRYSRV